MYLVQLIVQEAFVPLTENDAAGTVLQEISWLLEKNVQVS